MRGDTREVAKAQLRAAESHAGQKAAEDQVALTAKLVALCQQLDTKEGAADAKQQLDNLLAQVQPSNAPPMPPT